jgi:hypothetical protein
MVRQPADHDDGGMGRMRWWVVLSVCALAGCSAGTPPSSSTSSAPPSTPPTTAAAGGIRVEAVIDLKGAEAYGLTADASAVWAISYQGATCREWTRPRTR